jgi:hypothetical protein
MTGARETNVLIAHVTPPGTPSPGLSNPHSSGAGFHAQGAIDERLHRTMSAGSRGTHGQPLRTPSLRPSEVVWQRATSEGVGRRVQRWLTVSRQGPSRRKEEADTVDSLEGKWLHNRTWAARAYDWPMRRWHRKCQRKGKQRC